MSDLAPAICINAAHLLKQVWGELVRVTGEPVEAYADMAEHVNELATGLLNHRDLVETDLPGKMWKMLVGVSLVETHEGNQACPECEWDSLHNGDEPHDHCELQDLIAGGRSLYEVA